MSFWGGGGEWLKPTWTLAVEEQFYLLLPLLVMWIPKRFLIGTLLGLCGVAILFRYAFYDINYVAALTLLPARMDLLLGGVVVAYAMRHFDLSRHLLAIRIIPLILMVVLLIIAVSSRYQLFPVLNPTLLERRVVLLPAGSAARRAGGPEVSVAAARVFRPNLICALSRASAGIRAPSRCSSERDA